MIQAIISHLYRSCNLLIILFFFLSNFAFAQGINVSGNVSSLEEGPLPGVNILIKGTSKGTISDVNGDFIIEIPDTAVVLVFSSVGYISQKLAVGNQNFISVELNVDVTGLDEIVVIGYTSKSKKDITGAISTVSGETLNEVPAASFTEQLQGRASGVVVGQDNKPGGEPLVRIRGWGTINDNDPLYIIDGIPTKSDIQAINPANIESIQILKDASAASIYGSRAANGVIIVTTKKGESGKPKLTFNARVGIQYPTTNKIDLLNTQELGELYYRAQRNDYIANNGSADGFVFNHGQYGSDPTASDFIPDYIYPSKSFEGDPGTDPADYSLDPYHGITRANKEGTDWYDEVFNPAPIQEYNLGINGGNESSRYYVSFNYFNQEGTVKHSKFERFTIRVNTDFSLKKWFRIGENLEVSYIKSNNLSTWGVFRALPILPIYDIDGYYGSRRGDNVGGGNPVATLERFKDNNLNKWRIFGAAFMEIDIVPDLTFKTQFGFDYRNLYSSNFFPQALELPTSGISNGLVVDFNYNLDMTWYNTLNYSKSFNGIHQINILAGTEAIDQRFNLLGASRTNFYSEDINYRYLTAGSAGMGNRGSGSESYLFSVFAKVNYVFRDKYLIDATVRRDGSSRFSENNRYATFPAVSIGWRLSEEPFLNGTNLFSDLKLRASWGQMGNQEIANYNEFNTYRSSIGQSAYDISGSNTSVEGGFDSQKFGNPNGVWETTTIIDIGLDWTLWNALTLNFDYYHMTTTDMLYRLTLPGTGGSAEFPYQNVGEMANKGFDLDVNWVGKSSHNDFSYNLAMNISHYQNEIIKLSENVSEGFFGNSIDNSSFVRNEAGHPYSSFYGYIIDGFTDGSEYYWTEDEEGMPIYVSAYPGYYDHGDGKGRFKYKDINGDTVITNADRTYIGNPHPDFTFGFSFNATYKNFDFSLFLQGSYGNDIINYEYASLDFVSISSNSTLRVFNESWTPELGDASKLPILSAFDNISSQPSTYYVEDGSYVRLKNIQVGYTLPEIRGISILRFYFQATNVFTITNYRGLDPEINISGKGSGRANLGVDNNYFPASQQYLVGVNFGF